MWDPPWEGAHKWSMYFLQRGSMGLPDPGTPLGLCGHPVNPLNRLRRCCSISTFQRKKAEAQSGPAGLHCFQHFSDPRSRTRLLPPGPQPPSGLVTHKPLRS